MRRFFIVCLAFLASIFVSPAVSAAESLPNFNREVLNCPTGLKPCNGKYGNGCFSPALGNSCTEGQICSPHMRACVGRLGNGCYNAGLGQSCTSGLICPTGLRACTLNGKKNCIQQGQVCQ